METNEEIHTIMDEIEMKESPVGFNALKTHAMILNYLRKIEIKVNKLEEKLK